MTWPTSTGGLTHVVHNLIGCPAVVSATYLLVQRSADGSRLVLAVRRTRTSVPSLNLARIRRSGARLGANEVHIYEGGTTDAERDAIVAELTTSLGLLRDGRGSPKHCRVRKQAA